MYDIIDPPSNNVYPADKAPRNAKGKQTHWYRMQHYLFLLKFDHMFAIYVGFELYTGAIFKNITVHSRYLGSEKLLERFYYYLDMGVLLLRWIWYETINVSPVQSV